MIERERRSEEEREAKEKFYNRNKVSKSGGKTLASLIAETGSMG